ncbi:hypothetical protein A3742_13655 [Oleiphilus sp. HI0071]|nr:MULTISPECIES: FimV/HubP family polar landmark protein [unclassified Oleiphilus]KZY59150.1 hypothetical protein A3737_07660 [Oleiphilus sp. HI0065]KZY80116.1 hypothetical protein A3742_13655 [Oleiphilus sp. HI0071]KZY96621.1 hypothetical protein A3744_13445 [Oleiphilus sp. HI0073]KZZ50870.1 hypothetical protein A3760_13575 [Oleiphilus sp. HI0122]KZZ67654.1 hypothetical protein A3765_04430 [Oleiphilus sp. HI0130]KZZ74145.1 hypothetical protein A3767_03820 [Oleiphilus sp. HI0133]
MIRKLAIALTLVSAGFVGHVQALGLGGAKVNSNLNQPLVAEIDLVNTGGLSDAEILPGLATREEFLKAGIDRVYFLSDIRFEVKPGKDGEPKIVLTTRKPVREPFLNFLVEVIWPSGRLLREYALLIDPPVFAEDKPIAATPAPVQSVSSTPSTSPVQSSPVTRATGDNVAVKSSVAPQAGALAGNESYGPTKKTDTLWEIATKTRPDKTVSPQQVMLAIQDLNPDAFIDNNINKLKAGQILRLPTKEQVQSRTTYQAINAVIEQNAALRKPKTKTPTSSASKPTTPAPKKKATSGDELKLVVPEKDSKASDAASSDPNGSAASGTSSSEDLSLTLEQLDKAKLENEELSGKVGDLEDQLETLQRILTLKNDQLANLQAQMRAAELEEAESLDQDGSPVEQTGVEDQSELAEGLGGSLAGDAANDSGEQLTEVVVSETVTDTKLVDANGDVVAEQIVVEEAVVEKPVVVEPKTQEKPVQDQILEQILSNPIYQAVVAGGLILLLVLLWMVSKSRAKQEVVEDDYDYEEASVEAGDAEPHEEEMAADQVEEPELAEDEKSSSEEGQEDVIAEADVYIAYGRLDQAATILEQGISADPVRVDYRLKLLEVYRDSLQEEAFGKQISELEAIQDQSALARAEEIRAELEERIRDQAASSSQEADIDHLLDEDEEQALLGGDDNNFDFDTVDASKDEDDVEVVTDIASEDSVDELESYAEEALDEVGDEVDFESDDLDVDLDIPLDLEDASTSVSNELEDDPGIDFESVDLSPSNDDEIEDAVVSDEERADLELDDALNLDDSDLDSETEIELDLSEELDLAEDDLSSLELEDENQNVDSEEAIEDVHVDDLSLELDEEVDLDGDASDELSDAEVEDLALDADDLGELEVELEEDGESDGVLTEDEALSLELSDDLNEDLDSEVLSDSQVDDGGSDADDLLLDLDEEPAESDPADALEITDETLDEAAAALGDADDFEPELSEDEDFDFLEGTDEASTKLDLARAYIDMGDTEGAKEILLEVEGEGSAEQQKQARELIDSIGG